MHLLRYYLCTVRYTIVVDLRLRMLINNQYSLSFSLRLSFTETSHLNVNRARFIRAGFFQLALPNICKIHGIGITSYRPLYIHATGLNILSLTFQTRHFSQNDGCTCLVNLTCPILRCKIC